MASSCNFDLVLDSTRGWMLKRGIIDENMKIVSSLSKFTEEVDKLTKQAKDKWGVDYGQLFTYERFDAPRLYPTPYYREDRTIFFKAIPNMEAFAAVQAKKYGNDTHLQDNSVNYTLKAVNALATNLDRADALFQKLKDTDTFWAKLQKDFQIPKQQIELLRETPGDTLADKIVNFSSTYQYDINIKTANTQHYSNLTVPGGTNYTENEISTPLIVPSIKGHAQFSTDNGMGWFRSDEQVLGGISIPNERSAADIEEGVPAYSRQTEQGESTKTRRILEIQSDWGQKQRKSSEPDINIKYDIQQIVNDLQKLGDLKIDCN